MLYFLIDLNLPANIGQKTCFLKYSLYTFYTTLLLFWFNLLILSSLIAIIHFLHYR